jgi:hypothetical protein
MWLRHSRLRFQHVQKWFLHAEYDFVKYECDNDTHECDYDVLYTNELNFNTMRVMLAPSVLFWHSGCNFGTLFVIWTIMRVILTRYEKITLLQFIQKSKLQAYASGYLKNYHPHACRINTLRVKFKKFTKHVIFFLFCLILITTYEVCEINQQNLGT